MYLLATRANDASYMPALIHELSAELGIGDVDAPAVWGVGYYGDDRALTMRRPVDAVLDRGLYPLVPDVCSSILVACASPPGGGEAPAPYRFRRWLFGHAGDLSPLEAMRDAIAPKLPDFIRLELGAGSVGELAFAMTLAEFRRSGVLDDPLATEADVRAAFTRAIDSIRGLSSEAASGELAACFAVSNGRHLSVASAGAPVGVFVRDGLESLPDGPVDEARTDYVEISRSLRSFRAVVFAAGDRGPEWTVVPDGAVVGVDAQLNVLGLPAA
jgi:hypothetical protein